MNEQTQSDSTTLQTTFCIPSVNGHCLTCSDEAIPVRVLAIDTLTGLALVSKEQESVMGEVEERGETEEIDIMLVDDVTVGDILLAHGGVAIGQLEQKVCL